MWSTSADRTEIDEHDVVGALDRLHPKRLRESMFNTRWKQMPTEERRYVTAVAALFDRTGAPVTN